MIFGEEGAQGFFPGLKLQFHGSLFSFFSTHFEGESHPLGASREWCGLVTATFRDSGAAGSAPACAVLTRPVLEALTLSSGAARLLKLCDNAFFSKNKALGAGGGQVPTVS